MHAFINATPGQTQLFLININFVRKTWGGGTQILKLFPLSILNLRVDVSLTLMQLFPHLPQEGFYTR